MCLSGGVKLLKARSIPVTCIEWCAGIDPDGKPSITKLNHTAQGGRALATDPDRRMRFCTGFGSKMMSENLT